MSLTVAMLMFAAAADPVAPKPDYPRGLKLSEAYFRGQAKAIADASLADIKSAEDWRKRRPEKHRQFLDMMGLWPLPPKTDLHATITGTIDVGPYTIEKLHFQSQPGLYVTGNLYVPKNLKEPAPAVLYVCGHGNVVEKGVSYGSKVRYQHHPAWFASHGYVSLILDTLELGEIPGNHHGTSRDGLWWWQSLGYTPGGVELWNAMRALDYLQSRKEVDPKRLGVTGRSGGGATSWWLAAGDDRVQAAVPVAGIADLWAHLVQGDPGRLEKGVIAGHCDCMYTVNTYRWDYTEVMALTAPRALLLGNSDADPIFPVAGYRRMAEKVSPLYGRLSAGGKFGLLETQGPHLDTPELRAGAFRWMNVWLKGDPVDPIESEPIKQTPQRLKVFETPPTDAINPNIHEKFVPAAVVELPDSEGDIPRWWKGKADEWRSALMDRTFGGWTKNPPDLGVKLAADVTHAGVRLRAFDFISEENVPLRTWLLTAEGVEKPSLVVLNVLDDNGYREVQGELGPGFEAVWPDGKSAVPHENKTFEQNKRALAKFKWAYAYVAPRGVGPTRWAEPGSRDELQIRRRYPLIGQTLEGQQVWDVRRTLAVLRTVPDLKDVPPWLQGKQGMAAVALFAAAFEPDVARLDLWNPPATYKTAPAFLNFARILDLPQAMALAFPKRVMVYVKDDAEAKAWDWPLRLQKALGQDHLKIRKVPG